MTRNAPRLTSEEKVLLEELKALTLAHQEAEKTALRRARKIAEEEVRDLLNERDRLAYRLSRKPLQNGKPLSIRKISIYGLLSSFTQKATAAIANGAKLHVAHPDAEPFELDETWLTITKDGESHRFDRVTLLPENSDDAATWKNPAVIAFTDNAGRNPFSNSVREWMASQA